MNKRRSLIIIITVVTLFLGVTMLRKGSPEQNRETKASAPKSDEAAKRETLKPQTPEQPVVSKSNFKKELASLPTISDLQNLSEEEVHHAPQAIIDGGRVIGRLIEKAELDTDFRESTVKFLLQCAESEDVVPAIRAVCWKNTISHIKKWKVFVPVSDAKISPRVLEISSLLP